MKIISLQKMSALGAVIGLLVLTGFVTDAANINWTNTASGGWNTAANWNPNSVPGSTDTAIITNAGVTVTLNGATTVAGVILGTNGAGTVTLSLNGQTLALNGPLTVNPSGSFTVDSGTLNGNTNAVLNGPIGWSGGFLGGTLTLSSLSTLNLTTTGNHDMPNCTFTNNGTVTWNNGTIRIGSSGTTIYNYGLWNAQSDQAMCSCGYGGGGVFNNYGTFRKSGGASEFANNTIFQSVAFNQLAGVIDVQNGTNGLQLNFQSGGSFTGGYITTNVSGLTVFALGSFNLNGTVTGTNTWENNGDLVGVNVIKGALTWVGGLWTSATSTTITTNSTLLVTSGGNHDMANCTVTNSGTVAWANGTIRGGQAGTTVYNYGLWDAQSDQFFCTCGYGGAAAFNNYGTFRKSGGASEFANNTIFQSVAFNQLAGVIDVQNGTNGLQLNFQSGGSFTGGYITTNVSGLTVFALGSFNLNGTVTGTNTWENNGDLVGVNVIKGALTWVGGLWTSATSTTITTNSTLLVTSGGNHDMANCTVTNSGTVAWANGTIRGGQAGTTVYNYGLWDAQSDQFFCTCGFGGAAAFNNYGTFRKSGGASELANNTIFQNVTFNQLAGLIDVQNGTNGLQLNFQSGGSFTGGYITTNKFGLTVFGLGSFNLNGTVTGTNTWENNGNLVGTNVINGNLTWVGGVWNGAVVTIPANSSVLVIGGGGVNDMNTAIVTNSGTVKWASGTIRGGNGTTINNLGVWDAQSDQQMNAAFGGAMTFNNSGTFRKSGGAGIGPTYTLIAGPVVFNQLAGVIDTQNGTNGLELAFQGGGNFVGGYITTNVSGLNVFSLGSYNLNGTVTGTNTWENNGNLVGTNVIKGALTWVGGTWSGAQYVTISSNSTVLVVGGAGLNDLNTTTVTNYGTVAWASGQMRGGNGATIFNYGLWDAQSDQQLNAAFGGAMTFNNIGTFRKSGGTGDTLITGGTFFNQISGLMNVQKGNVYLGSSGNFAGGSISNGIAGTLYLNAGSFNITGTTTSGNMVENAGNLVGNNVINGSFTWAAGVWSGAAVTMTTNSVVTIAGGGLNDMNAGVVTNNGTVLWASGQIRGGNSAVIVNNGLWDAQSDQQMNAAFGGAMTFNNNGTFRKEFTSGVTSLANPITFNNNGKLDAQNGNIALQGGYTLANGTKMGFGLGGSAGNGSVSLSGTAAFVGSISVNLNGFFWPGAGSTFNLLNYTSETGVLFTNMTLPAVGYLTWQTNYNATAFVLTTLAHTGTNTTSTNLFISQLNSSNVFLQWPGDHTGWRIQAQTNPVTVGLRTNWASSLAGSSLTNQLVVPVVKTNGTVFFRMIYP